MCGIFGFWLNHELTEDDIQLGKECTEKLFHRGPDDGGIDVDVKAGLFLGHRRLSIIDITSGGKQPLTKSDCKAVFNGEIYNFLELREDLRSLGHKFTTSSDTEVLVSSFCEWDTDCLTKFDGMFSFAALRNNCLTLAVDPFGEKPLFYYETRGGIYFSSEPGPLISNLNLQYEPTSKEIAEFLLFGFISDQGTGYPGLKKLAPGTFLKYRKGDSVKKFKYWSSEVGRGDENFRVSHLDDISDILLKSLSRRLRSDVPLGIFLSSGIDSSLLAAMSTIELGQQINTYTVAFPEGENEAPLATKIADFLHTQHKTIISEPVDYTNLPLQLKNMYGIPNDNVTALSLYKMSLLAKNDIKVALTGTGGDELALGYNKYSFCFKHKSLYTLSPNISRFLSGGRYLSKFHRKTDILYTYFGGSDLARIVALKNGLTTRNLSHFIALLDNKNRSLKRDDMLSIMHDFDINNTLPNSYLAAMDIGSMRAGLGVRAPFLNTELFELMRRFNKNSFLKLGLKYPLIALLKRYLPPELISNQKLGFIAPIQNSKTLQVVDHIPQTSSFHLQKKRNMSESIELRQAILDQFLN